MRKKIFLLSALLTMAGAFAAEFNAALDEYGAVGKVSGNTFNKAWSIKGTLHDTIKGKRRYGLLLNPPMVNALCEIRLIMPVDVQSVGITGLDYGGTRQTKAVDIFLDGQLVKENVELPETPGKMVRVPLDGRKAQLVGIKVKELYPVRVYTDRKTKQQKQGPVYGGFDRFYVFSKTDLSGLMKAPENYKVEADNSIAFNEASVVAPKVYTKPRQAKGNPCTLWDSEDIAQFKEMLKTSPQFKSQYEALKAKADARMTKPFNIPKARKDKDGNWIHISDREYGARHNALSLDISNLGMVYALSGEEKYAEFAKDLMLAYQKEYKNYGIGARPRFNHDPSKVFDQRLSDATWLIQVVRGYDLIYNSPCISKEDRKIIEDDFIKDNAFFISKNRAALMSPTNWSAIQVCAILMAGYATHDAKLIEMATKGYYDAKRKTYTGGYPLHFSDRCIGKDGLWSEGSTGYQFMAMQALVAMAETLYRNGIDMYSYNNGAFKKLFDSPMTLAYPDLETPAVHDGGGGSILGYNSNVWEYGYKHYRDPNYITLLKKIPLQLVTRFQIFTSSCLYDLDLTQPAPPININSVNFFDIGFGITRLQTPRGQSFLFLDYGPNRSHGHPDKLNIDFWANGERLILDPGSVWYEQPLYGGWYARSIAHNTLVVDEKDQRGSDSVELVFSPGETAALQRAKDTTANPGVTMDRSLFMTPNYVLDIFGGFSQMPRLMDLPWHMRGRPELPSEMKERKEKFTAFGYDVLDDVKEYTGKGPFVLKATSPTSGITSRLISVPAEGTEYITGLGHFKRENPITVIERRRTNSTVFCNAVDYSGDNFVASVKGEGGLDKGFYLATVETKDGIDYCFAAFASGVKTFGNFSTDAIQVFVQTDKAGQVYSCFFAGGTFVKGAGFELKRDKAGLASVEKTIAGSYIVSNQSETAGAVSVSAPWNKGLKAEQISSIGEKVKDLGGSSSIMLPPGGRAELKQAGSSGFLAATNALKLKDQAVKEAAAKAEAEAAAGRSKGRREAVAKGKVKDFSVTILAKDFKDQTNGKVNILSGRAATKNDIVQGWNSMGHSLTWEVDVPADGYYALKVRYATEMSAPEREVFVNGEMQEKSSNLVMPITGGWARTNDDWKIVYLTDTVDEKPLPLKLNKGKNLIKLVNSNGEGVNFDYLVVESMDKAAL